MASTGTNSVVLDLGNNPLVAQAMTQAVTQQLASTVSHEGSVVRAPGVAA